jgi:putative oxidoreductase
MESLHITLIQLSHILIGFYYTFFGLWNIYHWKPITELMVQRNIPSPLLLLSIAIGWQVICGVMIMSGSFVKIAALLLIPFTLMIVFLLHPFWNFKGELRKQHMALFITNLTMSLGALILLAV